jgi:NADH-quinone oxidoreductase subunit I
MPGRVIAVQRRDKFSVWDRFPVSVIARELAGAFARLWARRWSAEGRGSGMHAPGYASAGVPVRGMPVLVARDDGRPRCVACGLCEVACPPRCIALRAAEIDGRDREPASFEIDMARCLFCGLCEEACPEQAIVMSRHVEIAAADRESLVFGQRELLVPAELVAERIAFLGAGRGHTPEAPDRC